MTLWQVEKIKHTKILNSKIPQFKNFSICSIVVRICTFYAKKWTWVCKPAIPNSFVPITCSSSAAEFDCCLHKVEIFVQIVNNFANGHCILDTNHSKSCIDERWGMTILVQEVKFFDRYQWPLYTQFSSTSSGINNCHGWFEETWDHYNCTLILTGIGNFRIICVLSLGCLCFISFVLLFSQKCSFLYHFLCRCSDTEISETKAHCLCLSPRWILVSLFDPNWILKWTWNASFSPSTYDIFDLSLPWVTVFQEFLFKSSSYCQVCCLLHACVCCLFHICISHDTKAIYS